MCPRDIDESMSRKRADRRPSRYVRRHNLGGERPPSGVISRQRWWSATTAERWPIDMIVVAPAADAPGRRRVAPRASRRRRTTIRRETASPTASGVRAPAPGAAARRSAGAAHRLSRRLPHALHISHAALRGSIAASSAFSRSASTCRSYFDCMFMNLRVDVEEAAEA